MRFEFRTQLPASTADDTGSSSGGQTSSMSEESHLVFREDSNLQEDSPGACRRVCPKVLLVFIALYVVVLALFLTVAVLIRKESAHPHVILIVADDLGWGDVEVHDADMRTPNLQALLETGVLLNNSYAHPLDSPSRAALFTGLYPFHMGLQHETMDPYTPTFLPDNFTLLPSHLQKLGYKTHLVGKWHLGFCDWKYTPASRGFDSFAGFYADRLDYYTHRDDKGHYDFRAGGAVDLHAEGTHSVHVLTDRATYVIKNHDKALPLFLVLAFQAIHAPVQVPQEYLNSTCAHINDTARQKVCGLAAMMDEAIGNVTSALRDKEILDASVIIVTSDNGGVTSQGSSNGPFRGEHGELYEGGTRVFSMMSSPKLLKDVHGSQYSGLFHQVDWLPTILTLSGSPGASQQSGDGVSHWHTIRSTGPPPRAQMIYNLDDDHHHQNAAIRIGRYKLIRGSPRLLGQGGDGEVTNAEQAHHLRLYDLEADPGEENNLAHAHPDKVTWLTRALDRARHTLVQPLDRAQADPKADPALWDGVWSPGWC